MHANRRQLRPGGRLVAVAVLVAALGACTSDPSDARVPETAAPTETTAGAATTAAATTVAAVTTSGAGPTASTVARDTSIEIVDFAFVPALTTVRPGTTVRWTNADGVRHQITAEDFFSEGLDKGDSFERTFDDAGEYPYFCGIHNFMSGTVVVA